MGKVELMQEKIAKQRQLPDEIKDRLNNITFINLLISIAIMIYMIVVNYLFENESVNIFTNSLKISALTLAIIDIIIFEISYRKESLVLAIHGIELLCFSLFILSIPYIYFYFNPTIRNIIMISSVYISIYYVGKLILIHIVETNKYRNNLSDVFEILEDNSESQSYLDEYENSEGSNIQVKEDDIISGIQELKNESSKEKEFIKKAKKNREN